MSQDDLIRELEAILMVVEEPVTVEQLARAIEDPTQGLSYDHDTIRDALSAIQTDYDGATEGARRRGFELREIAGGWRIYSRPEYASAVERFMVKGAKTTLSPAASEALAVIAYLQPTTRSRVAQIRGVNSDSVVKSLHARGLIQDVGHEEFTHAVLYTTTPYFLELLGLDSLDELPKLSPLLPGLADLEDIPETRDDT